MDLVGDDTADVTPSAVSRGVRSLMKDSFVLLGLPSGPDLAMCSAVTQIWHPVEVRSHKFWHVPISPQEKKREPPAAPDALPCASEICSANKQMPREICSAISSANSQLGLRMTRSQAICSQQGLGTLSTARTARQLVAGFADSCLEGWSAFRVPAAARSGLRLAPFSAWARR
jgi:hypothetical protein